MTRGIKVNIDEYLTRLEPFLKEGCSLSEACQHAVVPYTTVVDYRNNNEAIRNKIKAWQNEPLLAARKSVNQAMKTDGKLAMDFLKNKKSDEFSTRGEITGADGGPIASNIQIEFVDSGKD